MRIILVVIFSYLYSITRSNFRKLYFRIATCIYLLQKVRIIYCVVRQEQDLLQMSEISVGASPQQGYDRR